MLALIISSTKSIPHFKFYYCSSLLSLKAITLIIIVHCSQQSSLQFIQKKNYFIDSDCSRIFREARGQPLNQLCKSNVQLYHEASLQKKKNTYTHLPLLINYLSLSTEYQRLCDKLLKTTTPVAKRIKHHTIQPLPHFPQFEFRY